MVDNTAQVPPGFTEYVINCGLGKEPLRFLGRIWAEAQRPLSADVQLRYVLYETSDGQFVSNGLHIQYCGNQESTAFNMPQTFDTLDGAYEWFGDKELKTELRRQLAERKAKLGE